MLQFISLVISSMALLYLLFINVFRESFIFTDWFVVFVDLSAKVIIEFYILFKKREVSKNG